MITPYLSGYVVPLSAAYTINIRGDAEPILQESPVFHLRCLDSWIGDGIAKVKASIAITIVSSISFFGFLVGPPVIGWLAEATDLRIAISIAACLGLMIAFVAAKVGKRIS